MIYDRVLETFLIQNLGKAKLSFSRKLITKTPLCISLRGGGEVNLSPPTDYRTHIVKFGFCVWVHNDDDSRYPT